MSLRALAAVLAGRLAGWISRVSGRGGSSLPGLVARWIDPRILMRMAARLSWGAVLLTGTNGKTTTASMVRRMVEAQGTTLLSNRAGANLILGLTAAFVQAERWRIWPRTAMALLETDEATMPRACREIQPRVVAVTNFFRDQLDRYGELSTTVKFVRDGIAALGEQAVLVLNADDPQVAGLAGAGFKVFFYGLEGEAGEAGGEDAVDARFCPGCGSALHYQRRYYAHLGHYRCPGCGWQRPRPYIAVLRWSRAEKTALVRVGESECVLAWRSPGLYNLYNQAASIATAAALNVPIDVIKRSLEEFRPAFGRMESIAAGNTQLWLALVKNPVGFNQVLAAVHEDPEPSYTVMILINDRYADGQDVSWLWDVDFEYWISRLRVAHWFVGGVRGRDMAVRLKYAGVARDAVTVGDGMEELLDQAVKAADGGTLYILPTYTAMLEVRRILSDRGLVRHFREG